MKTSIAKHLLSALALAAAAGAAQAAVDPGRVAGAAAVHGVAASHLGERDPFTEGARSERDPFSEGARTGERDPFSEGARSGQADPYTDGARIVAGLDRSGVSAEPSRAADPYLDGARTIDVFTDGALVAARG
ncbi:hypothetical protein K6V92_18525 [Cupriavidus respiraculi]|uniref:hypothetical protein n=1 Tax=Cupriavidus respiraculi TaxID=195930 RepID=UPI001C93A04B|nr:hypothetical protein [Cupriavidus respiraculi]MBY4948614.1 hypothetical protein [Cupriavidus respiraculi]